MLSWLMLSLLWVLFFTYSHPLLNGKAFINFQAWSEARSDAKYLFSSSWEFVITCSYAFHCCLAISRLKLWNLSILLQCLSCGCLSGPWQFPVDTKKSVSSISIVKQHLTCHATSINEQGGRHRVLGIAFHFRQT